MTFPATNRNLNVSIYYKFHLPRCSSDTTASSSSSSSGLSLARAVERRGLPYEL